MNTKCKFGNIGLKRLVLVFITILFLMPDVTLGQEGHQNEWWYPILKKHNMELLSFNNYESIFEMGTKNIIDNKVVKLENAIFITKPKGGNYMIIRSPIAFHDLNNNFIEGDKALIESFNLESEDSEPVEKIECENFKYYFNSEKGLITNIKTQ